MHPKDGRPNPRRLKTHLVVMGDGKDLLTPQVFNASRSKTQDKIHQCSRISCYVVGEATSYERDEGSIMQKLGGT